MQYVQPPSSPPSRSPTAELPNHLELLHSRDIVGVGAGRKLMVEVVGSAVVGNRRVDVGWLAGLGGGEGPGDALRATGVDVLGGAPVAPRGAALAPSRDLPVGVVGLGALLVDGVVCLGVCLGRVVAAVLRVSWVVLMIPVKAGLRCLRTLPSAKRSRPVGPRWVPSTQRGAGC